MPGRVIFEYDEKLNIVFTEDHWEIKTRQDVDEFFAEYQKYFQKLAKKVYMISNIDDLLVHAEVADYYGEVAKNTVAIFLLGFARYGTEDRARMTVRTTSLKAKFPPNIYANREEAIKAIEKQKASLQGESKK